jgi:hypothetical protein
MRLHRLRRMGLAELSERSRQEAVKWLDRVGRIEARRPRPDVRSLDLRRAINDGPFFAGAESPHVPIVIERSSAAHDRCVAAADRLCAARFDLLGYHGLDFGDPIDWHLDPVSGRRSPLVHWSLIDPLDAASVGDSKVVWELNRHQWLVTLGEAYRFTANERYAAVYASTMRAWISANPPGMGINWASSLELSLRLIAWCWALVLFRGSDALSDELLADVAQAMHAHATHVERYLSYYFSPNTHLTGEALGLFYAGVMLRELADAARWRALGARILVEQSERQIHSDGVYFEHSTYYQRYTVEIYLHFLILAGRSGIAVPPIVAERVRRMLDFLLAIRGPDGSMPQMGDADGGWILPFERRSPDDLRGVFSTAAALFKRSDYAWAAGKPALETCWLLGEDGVKAFDALTPATLVAAPSRVFAGGGYAIMRSGWEADAHHLVFDAAPLGCPHSGGHGHADLLSVQCAAFGEPYLVDAGTYGYAGEPVWRNFFRSTAAHNTALVDGVGQAAPAGPFIWKDRPRARLGRWASTEAFDLADADHDAYRFLTDPVVHRRRVLFVKPRGYWVLIDDLGGAEKHQVELRFQFAPIAVEADRAAWVRARGHRGHALLVGAFATVPIKTRIAAGELAPVEGWVSADYGQRRPAPVLVYSAAARLPLRIVTLLWPANDPSADPPRVQLIEEGGQPSGLVFEDSHEAVGFAADSEVTVSSPVTREP